MKHLTIFAFFFGLSATIVRGESLSPSQEIDSLVGAALEKQGLQPNSAISDDVFLRRAYLDIAGRIPTIEEAEAFQSVTHPNKRSRLIESLLDSEAFVSNTYHFWADILRINGEPDRAVSDAYELWVKDAIRKDMPYDEMVYSLVTARGKFWDNGAVGYYFRDRGMPLDNMSNTVRIFLGTRLECAQCHNHPFDKWTQMDYYEMAAFSYGMNARNYDSQNRKLATRELKNGAEDLYRAKALELTGSTDFPYLSNVKSLKRYEEKIPEKAEDAPGVKVRKGKVKQMKRESKRTRLTPHEKLGLTKDEFVKIAEQCIEAGQSGSQDMEAVRDLIGDLYKPLKYVSVSETSRDVKLPHDYQYSDAKPLDTVKENTMFGAGIDLSAGDDKIEAYARWMTSPDNPTFTRVIVNRLWKRVFGQGIFEPIDELTDQTTITNPELLSYLEDLMRDLKYDQRAFLRVLYETDSYQRAAYAEDLEPGEPYYFQGPLLRRMTAEQIWDSLVALALPEADLYRPNLEKQLAGIDRVRRIYESLEERSFDEYMAMIRELAPLVSEQREQADEYRKMMAEARDADDTEAVQQLRKKYGATQKAIKRKIGDVAYTHLHEKVDGGELMLAMGFVDAGSSMVMEENTESAGEDAVQPVMTSLPGLDDKKRRKKREQFRDMDRESRKERKDDINEYRRLIAGMARASELPSPAKPGHFLRDFGQSDREVIDNAADNATVAQALNLLNGTTIQTLTNPYSVFGKRVAAAESSEEKARLIFQAMLTRQPTDGEIDTVLQEFRNGGEDAADGVVWALLNTKQFLFVQ